MSSDPNPAPATIVVVDDEAGLARALSRMLVGAGYRVITHSSAEDALAAIETGPIDLLITDVIMPGMTGFELATAARRTKPDLPIIVISAYFDSAMAEGSPSDVVHLEKPVSPVELVRVVSAALGKPRTP